jgi:hypothetical protein
MADDDGVGYVKRARPGAWNLSSVPLEGLHRKGKNVTNARKENLRCLMRLFLSPEIEGDLT